VDIAQIEKDLRRILSSRRSIVERTKMADRLCQKVNAYHALLQNENARVQFRTGYKALIERSLSPPTPPLFTNKSGLIKQMLDHANSLKQVEAIGEKLNRELGDF
jgi:hypothetical protein